MLDSGFVELKLDYSQAKDDFAIGDAVCSDNFSAGGHVWRVKCYPRGRRTDMDDSGEYLSLYLELVSHATSVTAVFDAFLLRRDGAPSPAHQNRCVHVYPPAGFAAWGWSHFARLRDLGSPDHHLAADDGRRTMTFVCGVIVLPPGGGGGDMPAAPMAPPRSDVASSLGRLLESGDGSDVAFSVGGETFRAHRAVLAARSPVLRAELLGSMAEATMPVITLHDIEPETFKAMLQFMYTDTLPPGDHDDLDLDGGSSAAAAADFLRGLLAAADRYAVDMLKLACAQKLFDVVSVDNVAVTLCCAEVHGCPELKKRCLDFFVEERNFRKVVLTQGYSQLIQSFPSLVDEIKLCMEDRERRVLQLQEEKAASPFSFSWWMQKLVYALSD